MEQGAGAVFLKSLVVRGFKSFAEKTTLAFEPGISVVVGPNGSGKSNIVDAICWVLGEQGPSALRGGKMEDVIFGGSAQRPPLGMADVELTIDNSARLLPVEFSEVSVGRTLFRSGDSEYRINGSHCRLLDIQELLSDAGVGREQHTIVGQGRLDEVLSADPMQMRGFIEDAAGVGKHRRRKDRALRKIASCETNLEHLADLLAEIRRQLRPLRQQAELAEKHTLLSAELGRIRQVRTARELAEVRAELGPFDSSRWDDQVTAKEKELASLELALEELHRSRSEAASRSARHREARLRLAAGHDRLAALERLARERRRTLIAERTFDSEAVEQARLQELRSQLSELEGELPEAVRQEEGETLLRDQTRLALEAAREGLRLGEEAVAGVDRARAAADLEVAGLKRDLESVRESVKLAERDLELVGQRIQAMEEQERRAAVDLDAAAQAMAALDGEGKRASAEVIAAETGLAEAEGFKARLLEEIRSLEKRAAVQRARAGARAAAESWRAASAAALRELPGAALLSELVELAPEHRYALEAVLGPLEGVVVVPDRQSAERVLATHGPDEAVTVLVAEPHEGPAPEAPALAAQVRALRPGGEEALESIYVASRSTEAMELAVRHPGLIFLSPDGTVALGGAVFRGSAEVADAVMRWERELARAREAMVAVESTLAEARRRLEAARGSAKKHELATAGAAERLRASERQAHALAAEVGHLQEIRQTSESGLRELVERSESISDRIRSARTASDLTESEVARIREEHQALRTGYDEAARHSEEARIRLSIAQERRRQLIERIEKVRASIASVSGRLAGLGERQEALAAAEEQAGAIAALAGMLTRRVAAWPEEAAAACRQSDLAVEQVDAEIDEMHRAIASGRQELEELRSMARREDLGRSELKVRQRILESRLAEELHADVEAMVERLGRQMEPASELRQPEDPLERLAYLPDDALKKRQARLERDLEQMGRVNPLAAQEAEALAEREEFLTAQMADVRASRRDLKQVVESVDEKIKELFSEAFRDVAVEYEKLFRILFPSGNGRLKLADAENPLETGIQVEASPSGRSLKRLSLLSGGERALSALALLFAIFRARPSPFYILDEVEAALDDVNLQRFLGLLEEFRGTSQLLVVTHQKKSMEIADVLYGVAIRPDGVSKVISERLSDLFPASPLVEARSRAR